MKKLQNEIAIENISNLNIHYENNTSSPICCMLQLDSGVVVLGLSNGNLYFYSQMDFNNNYSSLKIDSFPINSICQVQDDQLICCSGPFLYLILENNLKKCDYNKKEKIIVENIYGKINKILLLPDESIIVGDNKYISLLKKKGKKINFIKQIKINSPILDLIMVQSNMALSAVPQKQSLIFVDIDKFVQNYEIKNIKFYKDIKCSDIIYKLRNDLLIIGGCLGMVYFINLKNKQFIANISIRYKNELITTMVKMFNGDLLCGVSILEKDEVTQKEYICSNLVQYKYDNKIFKEIFRKPNVHNNVIIKICEIVNRRGISEFGTVSTDSFFKIWN